MPEAGTVWQVPGKAGYPQYFFPAGRILSEFFLGFLEEGNLDIRITSITKRPGDLGYFLQPFPVLIVGKANPEQGERSTEPAGCHPHAVDVFNVLSFLHAVNLTGKRLKQAGQFLQRMPAQPGMSDGNVTGCGHTTIPGGPPSMSGHSVDTRLLPEGSGSRCHLHSSDGA